MTKRNSRSRRQQQKRQKRRDRLLWIGGSIIAVFALVGMLLFINANGRSMVTFPDIHGMSFTGDGEQLRVIGSIFDLDDETLKILID